MYFQRQLCVFWYAHMILKRSLSRLWISHVCLLHAQVDSDMFGFTNATAFIAHQVIHSLLQYIHHLNVISMSQTI